MIYFIRSHKFYSMFLGALPQGWEYLCGLFNGKQSSYITVIGLIVVVIGIYGYFQPGNFSVPNAKATPSSYDFGRIDPKPVEKDFELGNTGDSTLRVSRVSTSCSCTTAEVSKEEIPAGNSAILTVNFDPR